MEDAHRVDALEHASETISKEEARGSLAVWFGVLGSPLAWGGHLVANYSLEEWFACSRSARNPGHVLGLPVDTVLILINTAMAVIALASGLVATHCWRQLRDAPMNERSVRARWMAFAGMVECCLFLGIILLGYLPAFTLKNCVSSP